MKYIPILLLFSPFTFAGFSRPELKARLNSVGAFNAPDNLWCFTSEPAVLNDRIYLACLDEKGHVMARWDHLGFSKVARAEEEQFFSLPKVTFGKVSWYEYSESKAIRTYQEGSEVHKREIQNLGAMKEGFDSFILFKDDSYFFRLKNSSPELFIWKKDEVNLFFSPKAAYIYTPQTGPAGEIALKTRDSNYDEESADKIWLFQDEWKVILKDRDADPTSPWISFRHQMAVDGNSVVALARDNRGEALILIKDGVIKILAREGVDLARFDYFSPKMRAGTIVVRGDDFEGRKVTYVYDQNGFRRLLTQGDVVLTDVGPARVHYKDQNAIFYGAPGIDERGNIVLQATLMDLDHPNTLLGIGLIKFKKE
jgi:hypothetical protein